MKSIFIFLGILVSIQLFVLVEGNDQIDSTNDISTEEALFLNLTTALDSLDYSQALAFID